METIGLSWTVVIQVAHLARYRVRISPDDRKQAWEGLNRALAARTVWQQIGRMTAVSAPNADPGVAGPDASWALKSPDPRGQEPVRKPALRI